MASKLFKISKPEDEEQKSKTYFERSNFIKPEKIKNLRNLVTNNLPDRLKCCKETRKERAVKKAISEMDKEIEIIKMIKKLRFFSMALKKLLSEKDRLELKERSRYIMVDPDSGEDVKDQLQENCEITTKIPAAQLVRSKSVVTKQVD